MAYSVGFPFFVSFFLMHFGSPFSVSLSPFQSISIKRPGDLDLGLLNFSTSIWGYKSSVSWDSFLPNFSFLRLSVLDLFAVSFLSTMNTECCLTLGHMRSFVAVVIIG